MPHRRYGKVSNPTKGQTHRVPLTIHPAAENMLFTANEITLPINGTLHYPAKDFLTFLILMRSIAVKNLATVNCLVNWSPLWMSVSTLSRYTMPSSGFGFRLIRSWISPREVRWIRFKCLNVGEYPFCAAVIIAALSSMIRITTGLPRISENSSWSAIASSLTHFAADTISASWVCWAVPSCLREPHRIGIARPSWPANSIKQPLVDLVSNKSPFKSASHQTAR